MHRDFLTKFSFLMLSLLIVSCSAQKCIAPSSTRDINQASNSRQPTQNADNLIAKKPSIVTPSQPTYVDNEVKPVKETGTAIAQVIVSPTELAQEKVSITLNVQFDTGSAIIKPEFHDDIKRIADFMNKYPSTSAVIEGHTDNVGKELLNVKLSHRRAANVKAYLVRKFGIDNSRIRAIGYDYQKPIADNRTAQGRQKNRRAITSIDAHASPNSLYSFFDDSDLPKGGPSIVNQETIDAKIKLFQEKHGVAAYAAKIVKAPTLELYKIWRGIFSHCAIRIETYPRSFYQLELQTLPDLEKAGIIKFHKIGAAITLLSINRDQFDVVEFTDKVEREKLDKKEPHYATMPICTEKKATRKSTQWYKDCLIRYAGSYNPENALKTGKPTRVFDYNPPTHNCCNFAEEALQACGLAHCFDLGKSSGLDSKTGPLEE
jgi:outer membrane protein OmpA-like peptidoglycan-associated protein